MHICKQHLPWNQWESFFGNSESETESCVSFVFHEVSQVSALIYFHVTFLLPGTRWSFEDERFRDKHQPFQFHWRWGGEGLLCSGIPSGCSWRLCRQSGERFCSLMSCSSFAFPGFKLCWLWVKWVNRVLKWTHAVWYDVAFLLGYWHDLGWKCIFVNNICRETSGNPSLETQSRKLRVVSHSYFTRSHRCPPWSTSMSLSFCQALAEALKNVSVTRIDLDHNSIGDGGVKALCVPGFQVAAHGAFVASLVKGFVVCCHAHPSHFQVSNFVDCEWSGWIEFWTELMLCGMMWHFYWDIGMILAGNAYL